MSCAHDASYYLHGSISTVFIDWYFFRFVSDGINTPPTDVRLVCTDKIMYCSVESHSFDYCTRVWPPRLAKTVFVLFGFFPLHVVRIRTQIVERGIITPDNTKNVYKNNNNNNITTSCSASWFTHWDVKKKKKHTRAYPCKTHHYRTTPHQLRTQLVALYYLYTRFENVP